MILDTNVLVSALVFPGGAPETVYRLVLTGRVEVAVSRPLLFELARVLTEKFEWEAEHAAEAVAQLLRVARLVEPTETVRAVSADPADDRVLEAAHAAAADLIVSGDRHLLHLKAWRGIRILSPAELVSEFA